MIYHQSWLPREEPKAVVLIAHGLGEHSGRYMNVVDLLVPAGYAVHALDHPGHGKSNGRRVYVERFQDFTATLKIYFDMIRDQQPDKPVFLVGHSMGGLIGTAYLLAHQHELAGAVLSGPGIKVPDDISPLVIFMGKLLSGIMPGMGIVQLEAEGVSRDPAVVDAYINDPLVHTGKITARLGAEMLKTMQAVTRAANQITLPLMILQGSADRMVDPAGARLLYDSVGSQDKTLKVYDGLYHEVFNEPEHKQVLQDVALWLEAHLT
jgi:alpha-beta hydrolase superfamily lysophospholipase